jgi:hypothetical protein
VPQYLGTLAAKAVTIINAEDYGRTVFELALRRTAIVVSEGLINEAYDDFDAQAPDLIRKARGLLSEAEASGAGWPEPDATVLNRAIEAAPEMPLAGFGTKLAAYIKSSAAALGAPIDYVGLAVITGAAGCIVGDPPATRQPSPSASPRCSCAAPQKEPPLKEGVSGTWLHRRSFCSMLGIDSPPFSEREGTFGPAELLSCILSCTIIGLSDPLDAPGSTTAPAGLLSSCFSLAAGDSA